MALEPEVKRDLPEVIPLLDTDKSKTYTGGSEHDHEGTNQKREETQSATGKTKQYLLPIMTVLSVLGAVVFGLVLRFSSSTRWSAREVMYVQFPGDVFLQMLKGLILPLIFSSIASAVGSLDLNLSKKIGGRAILYYLATTSIAVIEGVILGVVVQPGISGNFDYQQKNSTIQIITTTDTLLDMVRNLFPPNLIQSCIAQYKTVLHPPAVLTNATADPKTWEIGHDYTKNSNVLGLVVFAIVIGIALAQMEEKGRPVLSFLKCLSELMMLITSWVIWLSPVGVFFLIAAKMVEAESFTVMIGQLGLYFMTVLTGLLFHGLVVLPFIFFMMTRVVPIKFLLNMSQAIVTAFATASSSATLSVSMTCLEEKNGVDPRVTRFIMPIGATVNMDGVALYQALAVIFIAQVRKISLSVGQLFALSVSATMASVGAASVPQAGLVVMIMVLDTVGLPAEDISLIIAVDWFLERFRTPVNVLGDALGAGIVAHLSKKELENMN